MTQTKNIREQQRRKYARYLVRLMRNEHVRITLPWSIYANKPSEQTQMKAKQTVAWFLSG